MRRRTSGGCAACWVCPISGRCSSKQVHEDNIRLVTESDCGKGLFRQRDYASVDAMICREKHIPLVVFSADCGTILLYDPVQEAIGAVHAGWRGVASGLAAKTVRRMQEAFGTEPGNLLAATGPSIGTCCFETDDDVPEAMRRALGAAAEPYMVRRGENVAHRPEGHQCPVAAAGRGTAHRRMPRLHRLPPGALVVPSEDPGDRRGAQAALMALI